MVERRKVLHDVAPQHVAKAPRPGLQLIDGAVRPLAGPVGVAVREETGLEERLNDIAQCVVHDSVAEWCGADASQLRLANEKVDIGARPVGSRSQVVL
jgi:hypothetical protein